MQRWRQDARTRTTPSQGELGAAVVTSSLMWCCFHLPRPFCLWPFVGPRLCFVLDGLAVHRIWRLRCYRSARSRHESRIPVGNAGRQPHPALPAADRPLVHPPPPAGTRAATCWTPAPWTRPCCSSGGRWWTRLCSLAQRWASRYACSWATRVAPLFAASACRSLPGCVCVRVLFVLAWYAFLWLGRCTPAWCSMGCPGDPLARRCTARTPASSRCPIIVVCPAGRYAAGLRVLPVGNDDAQLAAASLQQHRGCC